MIMRTKKYPKYGDEGAEVLKYQKLLQKTGSTIKLSKKYTIGMISAIRCFQKKMGFKVTGKIDKKTSDALIAYKPIKKKTRV